MIIVGLGVHSHWSHVEHTSRAHTSIPLHYISPSLNAKYCFILILKKPGPWLILIISVLLRSCYLQLSLFHFSLLTSIHSRVHLCICCSFQDEVICSWSCVAWISSVLLSVPPFPRCQASIPLAPLWWDTLFPLVCLNSDCLSSSSTVRLFHLAQSISAFLSRLSLPSCSSELRPSLFPLDSGYPPPSYPLEPSCLSGFRLSSPS